MMKARVHYFMPYCVEKFAAYRSRVNVGSRERGGEACNVINGTISIMGVKMISAVYAMTL